LITVEATRLSRADVEAAAAWLGDRVVRTPVLRSAALDRIARRRLWLKAENLQATGSYEIRGALRAVGTLAREERVQGIVAHGTGSYAVAVAVAAGRYGLPAILVLPADASPATIADIETSGGQVLLAGTTADGRLDLVEDVRASTGYAVVDADHHVEVIAGLGTATWELVRDATRRGARLDAVVVPAGGGGLAGACSAVQGSHVAVYGAEPTWHRPSTVDAPELAGVVPVDDDAIARARYVALFHLKVLVEPEAGAALAAALQLAASVPFDNIGVLLTGGNADPADVARLVAGAGAPLARSGTGT
jgi:threonine dehydratase